MSTALALRLIASGVVSATDAEAALLSSLARRIPFVRALIDTGAIGEAVLDEVLEELGGIGLRQVAGMPELVNRLPPHFCRRLGVLPVRVDHTARVVEVAAADPLDPHIAVEVAFHLGVPVRVLRAPMATIEDAVRRIELEAEAAAGRSRRATPPFPHGAPESSNPPPPRPPEPAPIPLLRRRGEQAPPRTLRMYKQTLRPGEPGEPTSDPDLDDATGTSDAPSAPPVRSSEPPLDDAGDEPLAPARAEAASAWDGPSGTTDPEEAAPFAVRSDAAARAARESLRTTKPDVAHAADPMDAPASAMVPQTVTRSRTDLPSVSFPSTPPPSMAQPPALLPADVVWSAPPPASEPKPDLTALRQRKMSRFARPAIDIELPQPPSESRAKRQRSIWNVPLAAGGEGRDDAGAYLAGDEADATEGVDVREGGPERVRSSRREALDPASALEALRTATSRDEVVAAALRGLRTIGRRTAIFVVRRDGFHGWACNVELGDQDKLREVAVAHDAPSLFATAVAAGTYFGPIPGNAVHAQLLAVLEQPASDVAVAAAKAGGRPAMVLFADDLVDIKRRVLPRLIEMTDAVGAALSRLLVARL